MLKEEDLPKSATDILGNSKSKRITTLITSIVKNGVENIRMSDEVKKAHDELRSFMFANVYQNSTAKAEEAKAKAMIERLYMYFLRYPDKLPDEYKNN